MPRPPRLLVPGGFYHVYARGNRRQEILVDAIDRAWFLERLGEVVELFGWLLHAYCLMPNHYHLLLQTPKPNLSAGMHRLNFLTAQSFNRRHEVDGHLFQGRFKSRLVDDTPDAFGLSRYIVLNPVRAGLAKHPAAWRWSSYRAAIGLAPAPPCLTLDLIPGSFRVDIRAAERAYEEFVLERLPDSPQTDWLREPGAGSGPGTWLDQPKPYVPAKRSARRLTSSAAGRPTTFR